MNAPSIGPRGVLFAAALLLSSFVGIEAGILGTPQAGTQASSGLSSEPQASSFRAIAYNIWLGFRNDSTGRRRERVTEWLDAQQPDVVALQELNGFTEDRLRTLAKAWGHSHVALLKEEGFPTALTSRRPITQVERRLEGFGHGLLYGETGGVAVAVVHLSNASRDVRQREAMIATEQIARHHDGTEAPLLVLGDFNSLSPQDSLVYARSDLVVPGKGEHSVMRHFASQGLVDLVDHCGEAFSPSFPSEDPVRRIDYVLAGRSLAKRCTEAFVAYRPGMASDHYPVVADFDFGFPVSQP